ncbi:SEC-C metal-binding domain-containing protein [Acaryochloris sp. IP29b_bin.148]|uniref:SEC-C metal-binding domain-containing protein n=1 Tax=Acaryochloris sp. IP29b_bin.148 TaxID=2969218 RepID=UPI0034540CC9
MSLSFSRFTKKGTLWLNSTSDLALSTKHGKWFCIDGDLLPSFQPKKNEPYWCKSGKKFKQCHCKKS